MCEYYHLAYDIQILACAVSLIFLFRSAFISTSEKRDLKSMKTNWYGTIGDFERGKKKELLSDLDLDGCDALARVGANGQHFHIPKSLS